MGGDRGDVSVIEIRVAEVRLKIGNGVATRVGENGPGSLLCFQKPYDICKVVR